MDAIMDRLMPVLPFFLGSWFLFLVLTVWKPQRFRNSFVLLLALFFTVFQIAALFGDYMADVLLISFLACILILLLVPGLLIFNGITMLRKESFSTANALSLLLGIFIGAGELSLLFSLDFVVSFADNRGAAILFSFLGLTAFYFSCWILCFVLYMLSIQIMPHRMKFSYVIIHGCGLIGGNRVSRLLSNRLDAAIAIYRKCRKKPILIPSGGKGSDEALSEAEAMEKYLLDRGIPAEHILPECRSATTMENLIFSKELIESRGKHGRIALVSSNYHVYRCLLFAKQQKLPCIGIGAKVAWYYWPSAVIREFVAVFTKKPYIYWLAGGYLVVICIPFLFALFL